MNRRDLARLGLGMGLLPVAAGPTLSAEEPKPASQAPAAPSIIMRNSHGLITRSTCHADMLLGSAGSASTGLGVTPGNRTVI